MKTSPMLVMLITALLSFGAISVFAASLVCSAWLLCTAGRRPAGIALAAVPVFTAFGAIAGMRVVTLELNVPDLWLVWFCVGAVGGSFVGAVVARVSVRWMERSRPSPM